MLTYRLPLLLYIVHASVVQRLVRITDALLFENLHDFLASLRNPVTGELPHSRLFSDLYLQSILSAVGEFFDRLQLPIQKTPCLSILTECIWYRKMDFSSNSGRFCCILLQGPSKIVLILQGFEEKNSRRVRQRQDLYFNFKTSGSTVSTYSVGPSSGIGHKSGCRSFNTVCILRSKQAFISCSMGSWVNVDETICPRFQNKIDARPFWTREPRRNRRIDTNHEGHRSPVPNTFANSAMLSSRRRTHQRHYLHGTTFWDMVLEQIRIPMKIRIEWKNGNLWRLYRIFLET